MSNYPFYKKYFLHFFCAPHIKHMSSPTKILKYLAPYNTIKMKLILDKGIDKIDLMIADEMKHRNDIEMKLMMEEGKIRVKRLWNDL